MTWKDFVRRAVGNRDLEEALFHLCSQAMLGTAHAGTLRALAGPDLLRQCHILDICRVPVPDTLAQQVELRQAT